MMPAADEVIAGLVADDPINEIGPDSTNVAARVKVPGDRTTYFRASETPWVSEHFDARLQSAVSDAPGATYAISDSEAHEPSLPQAPDAHSAFELHARHEPRSQIGVVPAQSAFEPR